MNGDYRVPPGKPNAGNPWPGWFWRSIGFAWAWPSAAYEEVMESMTDCAFSCPISIERCRLLLVAKRKRKSGDKRPKREFERGGGREKLTLVVVYHVAQVVSAAVVSLAHGHGVVREVDIAVVAF